MHVHLLGVCGTFMGGLALLARELGFEVSGSDAHVYPPMSTLLKQEGIAVQSGYLPSHLSPEPDLVVIGNALSRGNAAVEHVLDRDLPYTSGPAFLADHVLQGRWVLAVAGTHGKTTTSSLLAWILDYAGLKPGFLIGGLPQNFGVSARLGEAPFFVVEADEYDSAFFDKRSKFVHYRPRTAVLNNLEFDHADIFPDLAAIERQFHHLVRTVPGTGLLLAPTGDEALGRVLQQGCWTPVERFAVDATPRDGTWTARLLEPDGSRFELFWGRESQGDVSWTQWGAHNVHNALAAVAAARHAGVPPRQALAALPAFTGVRRRLERRGEARGVTVYDDFAHHPTAVSASVAALRRRVGQAGRIVAILEPRSNTMRMGVHQNSLAAAFAGADEVLIFQPPDLTWDIHGVARSSPAPAQVFDNVSAIVAAVLASARSGDHVLVMSNGAFGGIHERLLEALGGP
ncbi:MAG TPA: UDP-N-acetylmuramate:L-alanyl-gamma-D-glutamyl-meso-diaminopimelate ligase [Gammaproteobacteria bacterium]|nr:UDP-N-acetylmuramate:L-alanyl-gamma-D-glutamyl-meso-diaminopimelate ligase [Gammaproteobacteria bacterium]